MPDTAAFDTLAAAETMTDAGIEETHAKAIAGVVRDGRAGLAIRSDIRRLEDKMAAKSDVAELKVAIAGLEARFTSRVVDTGRRDRRNPCRHQVLRIARPRRVSDFVGAGGAEGKRWIDYPHTAVHRLPRIRRTVLAEGMGFEPTIRIVSA